MVNALQLDDEGVRETVDKKGHRVVEEVGEKMSALLSTILCSILLLFSSFLLAVVYGVQLSRERIDNANF